MQKKDFLIGTIAGLLIALLASYLFVKLVLKIDLIEHFQLIKAAGNLGKIITLGALCNLGLFWYFLKKNQEFRARGVVFATLLLTILTLFL